MTNANDTAIIPVDEEILTDIVSDEALEAAAGPARGVPFSVPPDGYTC